MKTAKLKTRRKYITETALAIGSERMSFMNGEELSSLSISIEDGATVRKVRRVIEKKVSQNFWKNAACSGRKAGYIIGRDCRDTMFAIFGASPRAFVYR